MIPPGRPWFRQGWLDRRQLHFGAPVFDGSAYGPGLPVDVLAYIDGVWAWEEILLELVPA